MEVRDDLLAQAGPAEVQRFYDEWGAMEYDRTLAAWSDEAPRSPRATSSDSPTRPNRCSTPAAAPAWLGSP